VYDDGWQIDFEGMRRAITPQTRAIVVVHPNNPTGHVTKPWEAEELSRICRAHELSLIVDEVFLDYAMGVGQETRATAGQDTGSTKEIGAKKRGGRDAGSFAAGIEGVPVFVVSGLSKIAGLPQMKAAWIVATGPNNAETLERLEVIADTFLSMNAPVQWALPAWLADRAKIQDQIRRRVRANLAELDRQLAAMPTLERLAVEGGWYAVLRVPALGPDEQTVLALLERGVWVHPGYFFGLSESGWLVVSLLGEEAEFSVGLVTVTNYFRTNQQGNF
jgi:aspartate/methionine/tyrosine aminotransferase